jgi:hydrogenase maturation protein HypF
VSEVRCQLELEGRLQGVGFRPLAFRLARELKLCGWVRNTTQGVELALQGQASGILEFERRITAELPAHAAIRRFIKTDLPLSPESAFRIVSSTAVGEKTAEILPDLATCAACRSEVLDVRNRRYRYPFTCCTYCGPRYSVLRAFPYDRANTTMRQFTMCRACQAEYDDPEHRRFHAQTSCCAECGPQLALMTADGSVVSVMDAALLAAAQAVRDGSIVAVQGLGGFHLFCDAANQTAVHRLRQAKGRAAKPFALMVRDLAHARRLCEISPHEERALTSGGAPIVLLARRSESDREVCAAVAPELDELGVMLAYTPLHLLLLRELAGAAVATSGNLADEPICIEESAARARLGGIASWFLVHDRPIASRVDDSVVRIIAFTEVVLRAGRGHAPLVLETDRHDMQVVGLGPHQKNTVAHARQGKIILSPHIGTLDTQNAVESYRQTLAHWMQMHCIQDAKLACDRHPDYATTRIAEALCAQPLRVQHHTAHVLSCIAEHRLRGPLLGVAWDGTGYGDDGTLWGGELLRGDQRKLERVGTLRPFRLPGGAAAVREPRRAALGLLFEIEGEACAARASGWNAAESRNLMRMLARGLNSPVTTSVGRLFDAVAALLGLRQVADYEGQAAMLLEAAARSWQGRAGAPPYPLQLREEGSLILLDWEPWIRGILEDLAKELHVAQIAARFHQTLAAAITAVALRIGLEQVVLTGGCFQNRQLCEQAVARLRAAGFQPFWNQRVPPNDGGISVGQVMAGLAEVRS